MAGRVWVVGSLNVDRGWRVPRHPGVGETVLGHALEPAPGGKGLNQAVAACRMGADVSLVGCVGDDDEGRWLSGLAAEYGIDTSALTVTTAARTGSALIVIDAEGANTVIVDASANATFTLDAPLGVARGDIVVAQLEVQPGVVATAFAEAHQVGARTLLNPSPPGTGRSVLAGADIVVVNQSEACELAEEASTAETSEQALDQARAIGVGDQAVVVTLGAAGVVAAGPEGAVTLPGVTVAVVDTTGAGDCFLGVLAAALVAGSSLASALERANRASALAVTRMGTVAAMPTAAELDAASPGVVGPAPPLAP
ncbi:MAG: ribokinase [Acidimicrobiales bacterium]